MWLPVTLRSPSVLMRCWRGYLSAARCKWFAYGPADATATLSSLASLKSRMVTFLVPAYPGCPGKEPVKPALLLFGRSIDMIGLPKFKMVTPPWPCQFQRWNVILTVGLATFNLSDKFEVSISNGYEDMKGDAKCRKRGGLGVLMGHSRSTKITPPEAYTSFD